MPSLKAPTGKMANSLGGLDGLVLTAGIGEHAAVLRAPICERLRWLGVAFDTAANAIHASRISTPDSRVEVRVVPTDEEAMIALHKFETLAEGEGSADKLAGTDRHPHVAAIICVEREVFTRNSKTGLLRHASETAFYISNTPVTAGRAAEAIRAHWGVETTSHYTRDVTFAEDRSRIRTNPGVFARIRSFGFNILKANRTDTTSQDRYRAALAGIENLATLVAIS